MTAELVEIAPAGVPPNLLVPPMYRPLVDAMLRRSPTFARQCLRIANAAELTVVMQLASTRTARTARARTHIVRDTGRVTAAVVIMQTDNLVELIAHEIEHVIEQLDGVDLASKAALPRSGVHALDNDGVVFETVRARRAGLRVAQEFRNPPGTRGPFVW